MTIDKTYLTNIYLLKETHVYYHRDIEDMKMMFENNTKFKT